MTVRSWGRRSAGPLAHPRRQQLLDAVRENPGVGLRELARLTRMHQTTIFYHVRVLRQSSLILFRRYGKKGALFVPGSLPRDEYRKAFHLRDAWTRKIMDALRESPESSQRKVAQLVGISPAYASRLLRRLERQGLLHERREGRRRLYSVRNPALAGAGT